MKLLIQHGNLIDPVLNEERVMDILIENGQIAAISAHLEDPEAQVLDGSGMAVSAGLIDHYRLPGRRSWRLYHRDVHAKYAPHGGFP